MFIIDSKFLIKGIVSLALAGFFTLWFAPWLMPQMALLFIIGSLLYTFYKVLISLSNALVTSSI